MLIRSERPRLRVLLPSLSLQFLLSPLDFNDLLTEINVCHIYIFFFPMGLKADSSPLLVQVTPKAEAFKFCLIKGRVV